MDGYKCCEGLFADDVVLIAPSSSALRNMLVQVSSWANINEMKFGINKCATMIIRPKNFDSNGSPDPTFYIDNCNGSRIVMVINHGSVVSTPA